MANDKVYPKGVRAFKPHQNAPHFVKGSVVITLDELNEYVNGEGSQYLTEYCGKKQIKLHLTESQDGSKLNFTVDTYRK